MNNNLKASSKRRCKCGRYMSLGEEKAGIGTIAYKCPDCTFRENSKPLTSEQYYKQFSYFQ